MSKVYETRRLLLRTPELSFAPMVAEYYLRNRDFLAEWEPVRVEEYYTPEYQKKQLENQIKDSNALKLWISKKGEEDKVIGALAFNNIVKGVFLSCFLGYNLDKDEINMGYMTEAVKKGIEIMFQDYGLHRIEASIMPRNLRSLKVTKKLGFQEEGLSPQYLKINGKWEDHIHMVLLNQEII
ncbi:GNAT family N-acetyltransferase [Lacrimispora sp.]|uniref:GNAT family N-acetyltransferase n=1 Tax=Lacrimispora sp. TaxID=2719234 RepID=UPI00289EAAE3|nr:GNAT family N-acetyltransferase [Lacrimispora sp.]